jgi:hypothetical protein
MSYTSGTVSYGTSTLYLSGSANVNTVNGANQYCEFYNFYHTTGTLTMLSNITVNGLLGYGNVTLASSAYTIYSLGGLSNYT